MRSAVVAVSRFRRSGRSPQADAVDCYGISFSVLGSAGAGLRKDMLAGENLASANAALASVGQGMRIIAPLAGAGLLSPLAAARSRYSTP